MRCAQPPRRCTRWRACTASEHLAILIPLLRPGNAVILEQEPLNEYDPFAIAVLTLSGESLGYVPKGMTDRFRGQRVTLGVVEAVGRVKQDTPEDDPPWFLTVTAKPTLPALTIDLVPRTCWGTNLRAELPEETWDALRKLTYSRAGHVCEVCGDKGSRHPVECNERYHYDSSGLSKHVQTLVGLEALCPACHAVRHVGRSVGRGEETLVLQQLQRVNRWTRNEAVMYATFAAKRWNARSQFEWQQNWDALDELFQVRLPEGFPRYQEYEGSI